MPRTANHFHIPSALPPAPSVAKPQRPKSKSLQPCRCTYDGCGKIFSKRSNLKAHMRVHSGVLPYPCKFPGCTKRFRWKSSLKPHIRVHLASPHVQNLTRNSPPTVLTPSSSDTAISSQLTTTPHPQPFPPAKPLFNLAFNDNSGGHSPTAVNAPHIFEHVRQSPPLFTPSKPPVARVLFQDSHQHPDKPEKEEIDLSTDSVLSSSASYDTDVLSFTLDSPIEHQHQNLSNEQLADTDSLWNTDIQVIDPFTDISMVPGDANIAILSALDTHTGISANSIDVHAIYSQWMFSCSGSTVSSPDFTTSLNSISM